MNDPQLLNYLLGDGPEPQASTLQAFNEVELPPGLSEKTLNAVRLERTRLEAAPQNRWSRRWVPAALAVAAALMLVISLPKGETSLQGNLENMTAKGLEQSAPKVHLKLARVEDGEAVRHRTDHAYRAGEALLFRVQSDSAGWVTLLNVQEDRLSAVLQAPIQSGNNDLALSDGAIAQWQFDESDRSGFFAIVASENALSEDALVVQLQNTVVAQPLQPQSLCLAAQSLGWQCDAIEVMVTE